MSARNLDKHNRFRCITVGLATFSRCRRILKSLRTSMDIAAYFTIRALSSFACSFSAIALIS